MSLTLLDVARFGLLLDGEVSIPVGGDGGLVLLITTGAGWLVLGIAAVGLAESSARRRGSLGHY